MDGARSPKNSTESRNRIVAPHLGHPKLKSIETMFKRESMETSQQGFQQVSAPVPSEVKNLLYDDGRLSSWEMSQL